MINDFILPDIGEGTVECELMQWLVSEGDTVDEDQAVVEVMTDKALVEIPSPYAGVVSKLYVRQGEIAKVGKPLFAIDTPALVAAAPEAPVDKPEPAETPAVPHRELPAADVESPPAKTVNKVLATPAVRRVARERGIDLSAVVGSGQNGRILLDDLAVSGDSAAADQAMPHSSSRETLRGVRAVMAKRIAAALAIPAFSYGDEVDVTALLALYRQLKLQAQARGVRLTLTALFMQSLAAALQAFPVMHSRLSAEGDALIYPSQCNMGLAVDTPQGLVVPVIKAVESLSLIELAGEIGRLTALARDARLSSAELDGATITLSNIGVLGGVFATPLISAPQVAIAALGRIRRLPRYDDRGELAARDIMMLNWSADHRVIDGATLARFHRHWQGLLEQPVAAMLDQRVVARRNA